MLRNLIVCIFSYGEARAIEARDGKECLDIISSEKIDAVFCANFKLEKVNSHHPPRL